MRAVTLILASALTLGAGAALADTQAFWPEEADTNSDDMISRDEAMILAHEQYPAYNWAVNKGYPTADHRAALVREGACPFHRRSFRLLPLEEELFASPLS